MGDEISEYIFKLFAVVVGDSPWINHDTFCAIIDCTWIPLESGARAFTSNLWIYVNLLSHSQHVMYLCPFFACLWMPADLSRQEVLRMNLWCKLVSVTVVKYKRIVMSFSRKLCWLTYLQNRTFCSLLCCRSFTSRAETSRLKIDFDKVLLSHTIASLSPARSSRASLWLADADCRGVIACGSFPVVSQLLNLPSRSRVWQRLWCSAPHRYRWFAFFFTETRQRSRASKRRWKASAQPSWFVRWRFDRSVSFFCGWRFARPLPCTSNSSLQTGFGCSLSIKRNPFSANNQPLISYTLQSMYLAY